MAGTSSNDLEAALVNGATGYSGDINGSARYMALFTTNPNFETGAGGVEASGGSYAREAITFGAASGTPTKAVTTDVQEWEVGVNIAAGSYTGWGVYDASSGGTFLFGDTFGGAKTLTGAGDKLTFDAGDVDYQLD